MKKLTARIVLGGLTGLVFAGTVNAMTLTSPAFNEGAAIPALYTCQGKDISPPLEWADIPTNTEAFALVMRDPDAASKNWVHWVMYNLPLDATSVPADYQAKMAGTLVGKNSWNKSVYQGPCPSIGTHRYRFELYALDQALYVDPGLTADQLTQAMAGHILAMVNLTGIYGKP